MEQGIAVLLPKVEPIEIHFSQIVRMDLLDENNTSAEKKSTIGRAIIGGILLGGAGAIVGGLSGLGDKQAAHDCLVQIVFYEPNDESFKVIKLLGTSRKIRKDFSVISTLRSKCFI